MSSKNTSPFAGRLVFLGIQPPVGNSAAASNRVVHIHHAFPDHTWFVRSGSERRQAVGWQHGQPWFYLRLASGAALWLGWVVRGSIRWPMRLIRLSRPGYLPSTRARSFSHLRTSGLQLPDLWWCALMLLVTSDVRLRTSLLSSTESGQSPPSCGPVSVAPWPAACRWRLCFRRTRGTDRPSYWRSWRRS
jgi:hypothetical protein